MKKLFLTLISILFSIHNSTAQKIQPTYKNISYGPHQDMTLNFWKFESESPVPLLVHIHGGGWIGGKKNETVSPNELKKGYSFASIDYRLAGTELLPAAVHDAARAIQFLRTKAKEWNFNPARIAVIGGSAGAASSLWLAYHDDMADPKVMTQCSVNLREFVEQLQWEDKPRLIHFYWKRKLGQRAFSME